MSKPPQYLASFRKRQTDWLYTNLDLLSRVYSFLRAFSFVFLSVWVGGIVWGLLDVSREMISTGQPLLINDVRSSWADSAGFMVVILLIGAVGAACPLWELKLFRKRLAMLEARKQSANRDHLS